MSDTLAGVMHEEAAECCMVGLNEHVTRLRELTERLPQVPKDEPFQIRYRGSDGVGGWTGTKLAWDEQVAVQMAEADEHVTLDLHQHDLSREWVIVVSGAIRVEIGEIVNIYEAGAAAEFAPGQAHTVTTLEPTRVIAVTIPAEGAYPHDDASSDD